MSQHRKIPPPVTVPAPATVPAPGPDAPGAPPALRPLTARSVVASTLLGLHPPRLSARLLVASGELFGIAENATRTALSRMVAAGELVAVDGTYALTGRLLERQTRQDASRRPVARGGDGTWEMAVVTRERRSAGERAALRSAMAALNLAELREGVWMRPANLDPDRQPAARAVTSAQCTTFVARPDGDPARLAAGLWDLDRWSSEAELLRARMSEVLPSLDTGDQSVFAPAFELAAVVLRHLVADPMLPPSLLPSQWPGPLLRSEYDTYDRAFTRLWRSWYHAQVQSP